MYIEPYLSHYETNEHDNTICSEQFNAYKINDFCQDIANTKSIDEVLALRGDMSHPKAKYNVFEFHEYPLTNDFLPLLIKKNASTETISWFIDHGARTFQNYTHVSYRYRGYSETSKNRWRYIHSHNVLDDALAANRPDLVEKIADAQIQTIFHKFTHPDDIYDSCKQEIEDLRAGELVHTMYLSSAARDAQEKAYQYCSEGLIKQKLHEFVAADDVIATYYAIQNKNLTNGLKMAFLRKLSLEKLQEPFSLGELTDERLEELFDPKKNALRNRKRVSSAYILGALYSGNTESPEICLDTDEEKAAFKEGQKLARLVTQEQIKQEETPHFEEQYRQARDEHLYQELSSKNTQLTAKNEELTTQNEQLTTQLQRTKQQIQEFKKEREECTSIKRLKTIPYIRDEEVFVLTDEEKKTLFDIKKQQLENRQNGVGCEPYLNTMCLAYFRTRDEVIKKMMLVYLYQIRKKFPANDKARRNIAKAFQFVLKTNPILLNDKHLICLSKIDRLFNQPTKNVKKEVSLNR